MTWLRKIETDPDREELWQAPATLKFFAVGLLLIVPVALDFFLLGGNGGRSGGIAQFASPVAPVWLLRMISRKVILDRRGLTTLTHGRRRSWAWDQVDQLRRTGPTGIFHSEYGITVACRDGSSFLIGMGPGRAREDIIRKMVRYRLAGGDPPPLITGAEVTRLDWMRFWNPVLMPMLAAGFGLSLVNMWRIMARG